VTNVTPGRGGRPRETKDEARLRIPASLRHGRIERAVCLEDYARAALGVPGVARAAARALGGAFNAVLVLVDPEGQAGLTPSLREAVMDRIDEVRMVGREHVVREPEYVPLEVKLALCVEPGALPHRVRDAAYAALRPGTRERPGFFHPDRLSFGEEVELGELIAHVQGIQGVRSVKALLFRKLGVAASGPVDARIRLRSTEVARLDADDDYPEHGRLSVLVVGVDPGVSSDDFEQPEVA
jgi:predicted phage baseplate assembly protein